MKWFLLNRVLLSPAVWLLLIACGPKPAQIAYLAPLERMQEGFLDSSTYQIVTYGRALDVTKITDPKSALFPAVIADSFDQEEFEKYNIEQQALLKARKPISGIPFLDVMAAETNRLNPQELNVAAIDEKIRAPMEIKRVLFDNACTSARIMGLYRWLISEAMQMRLLHGATLPHEGIQKTTLDPRYFPPRADYVAESAGILRNLDQAMAKKKFRYEIVYEGFSKPELLECKVAIHVHRHNLQVTMPYMVPL